MTVLEARGIEVRYGLVEAVRGVDIRVTAGEVIGVLGANGAGKTSLLSSISGLVNPSGGTVLLRGADVTGQSVAANVSRGMVHVPEGRRIIAPLTVEDNLLLGGHTRSVRERKRNLSRVLEVFPRLADRRASPAGLLSGGEQQMLAFGRALMAEPEVLLLDEPSMGLAPIMVDVVMETVQTMTAQGIGVLMVEQNAAAVLRVASYAYVMEQGSVVLEGPAAEISNDAAVVRAYLGSNEVDDSRPS